MFKAYDLSKQFFGKIFDGGQIQRERESTFMRFETLKRWNPDLYRRLYSGGGCLRGKW
jgi:hypothetical protein